MSLFVAFNTIRTIVNLYNTTNHSLVLDDCPSSAAYFCPQRCFQTGNSMPRQLSKYISRALSHLKGTLHVSKLPSLCLFSRSAHSDVDAMNRELAEFFGVDHALKPANIGSRSVQDAHRVAHPEALDFGPDAVCRPGLSTDVNQYGQSVDSDMQQQTSHTASYPAAHPSTLRTQQGGSDLVQEVPPALERLQQCSAQLQEQVQAMSRLVRQVSLEQQQQQPLHARYQRDVAIHQQQQQQQQQYGYVPKTSEPSTPPAVQPPRPFNWQDDWQQQQQQQQQQHSLPIDLRLQQPLGVRATAAAAAAAVSSTPSAAAADGQQLTHVDSSGRASMVDVSSKDSSSRLAVASCIVHLGPAAFDLVKRNQVKKGDVLTLAQVAGIQGAKQTANLIPLCHNIFLSKVDVSLRLEDDRHAVVITATVKTLGQTGVEMEALTAASVSALTVYDMCKAVSKDIVISDVRLDYKAGGKSGTWERDTSSSSSSGSL